MTSQKLIKSIVKHHQEQTKNFNGVMSFFYGTVGILSLCIVMLVLAVALVNPLWFRKSLLDFTLNTLPVFFREMRVSLFKSYWNKVNLFEILKTN